jgi:hypothetical protein
MSQEVQETVKYVVDAAAAATTVGVLVTWLPPVAAILTIVWTLLRIYVMIFGPIYKPED